MTNMSYKDEIKRLNTLDDLKQIYSIIYDDLDQQKPKIIICAGTACHASGSSDIIRAAKRYIVENTLQDKISLKITGCHGYCEMGPFILTMPERAFYHKLTTDNVTLIIDSVIGGYLVEDLLFSDPKTGIKYKTQDEIPFYKKQKRKILGLNQSIDPIHIYDYFSILGYKALEKVLSEMKPEEVIEEIKKSGLRGRGGAGFPTGLKWEALSKQKNEKGKYVVCNADEGDPGAYMDSGVSEGNPHIILEGMMIAGYATGANEGIIYIRAEYPLAVKHLTIAIRQAKELGLLGKDILGTGFNFNISIKKGAGAFVCGEETALMRSVEGKVGEPRQRPPYPFQKGIYGKPTIINNVETWANVPLIINQGAEEYAKIGTEKSKGTKIFSLVGKISNTGLVEVPMGMTIKEIVYDIGGGSPTNFKIKAVQTGGQIGRAHD